MVGLKRSLKLKAADIIDCFPHVTHCSSTEKFSYQSEMCPSIDFNKKSRTACLYKQYSVARENRGSTSCALFAVIKQWSLVTSAFQVMKSLVIFYLESFCKYNNTLKAMFLSLDKYSVFTYGWLLTSYRYKVNKSNANKLDI